MNKASRNNIRSIPWLRSALASLTWVLQTATASMDGRERLREAFVFREERDSRVKLALGFASL